MQRGTSDGNRDLDFHLKVKFRDHLKVRST